MLNTTDRCIVQAFEGRLERHQAHLRVAGGVGPIAKGAPDRAGVDQRMVSRDCEMPRRTRSWGQPTRAYDFGEID